MPSLASPGPRWLVYVLGLAALCVAAVAVPSAVSWYGRPTAGILVGPNGVVSSVGNASWNGYRQGLRFPDRLVSVDGEDLGPPVGAEVGRRFSEAVQRAADAGRSEVEVVVEQGAALHRFRLRIEPLDAVTWWLIPGSLLFAGALYVVAGMIALWVNPRGRLARSFATLATACGFFLLAVFDYHTSYRLVPVFYLAFAVSPGAACMVALRLPDDAPLLLRLPWLEPATVGTGLCGAATFITAYWRGWPTTPLQVVWTTAFGLAAVFFTVTFAVRYALAKDRRRHILRALLVALVPPHAGVGVLQALQLVHGIRGSTQILAYPALALGPMATAFAFVRYDLWGGRALLSNILTKVIVAGVACVLGGAAGSVVASELGVPFHWAVLAASAGGVGAALMVALALNVTEQLIFPSRAQYKPTVEQLSEDLTSLTSTEAVARAVERTVRRWLPCDHVRVALEAPSSEKGAAAEASQIRASSPSVELALPVRFAGDELGILEVGSKPGGALFTTDDRDLLDTIVNQGALALAHARAYQELERRRQQQAAAWRGEREALVETVAAQIAHEIRYPLNYFRSLFERALRKPIDADDIDIGREEVERLERMVAGLRRVASHRLERRPEAIRGVCERAEVLLRDELEGRELHLEGDPSLTIRCDVDQVTQMVVNLLSNALQATDTSQALGVTWARVGRGATVVVWDEGPGFVGDAANLFAPWYTTKEGGTGLGLAITRRLVLAHGWDIEACRLDGRTRFTIAIRDSDVVQSGAAVLSHGTSEVA